MEGTELILLHVHRIQEPIFFEMMSSPEPKLFTEYTDIYRDKAQSKLQEFAAMHFHGQKVRCEVVVSRDDVAEGVCKFAADEKCDLIVMGSRGHTTLGALFLGSVAQRVLLLSKCPTLIVPPAERAAQS